jgi:hypothetical protein
MAKAGKPLLSEVAGLAVYASVVMIVVPLIVFFIRGIADGMSGHPAPSPLTSGFGRNGVLSPFVWVPGLVAGLLVNLIRIKRKACWVWLIGVVWLAFGVANFVLQFDPRLYQGCSAAEAVENAFFILNATKCGGVIESGSFFSLPAICAISFALGAWLASLLRHEKVEAASLEQKT